MDYKNNSLYEKAKLLADQKPKTDAATYAGKLEELLEEHRIFEIELEYQNIELRRIQADLENTASKYKDIYDNNPSGYFTIDENKTIISANLRFSKLVKEELNEIIGQKITHFIAPQYQDEFYLHIKSLQSDLLASNELKLGLQNADGEIVFCVLNCKTDVENQKNISCAYINVNKLHEAEQKLSESYQIWNTTFDSINHGIAVVKSNFSILQANRSLCEMFEISKTDILNRKLYSLLHDYEKTDNCIVCKGIHLRNNTAREYFESKLNKYLEISVDPIDIIGDYANCSVVTIKDITERKLLEQELEQSEKRYKSIFENSHTVMLLVDPDDGNIIRANPAAVNFYGYEAQELENFKISNINMLDEAVLKAEISKAQTDQKNYWKLKHIISTGEIKDVELFCGPVLINQKQYIFSIIHDITEQVKLDEALKSTNEELFLAKLKAEESDKLKSAFLANMSHEIRTPLNGILGFAELLNHDSIDNQLRKNYAGIIINSGKRLLEIINDVLDLSKIESGSVNLKMDRVDLVSFFNEIFLMYAERQKPDLKFKVLHPVEDSLYCIIDKTRVFQIVGNLLSNAFKFTEKGSIILEYFIDSEKLIVKVSDTGIGIEKQHHQLVFNRFQQVENKITVLKGTGLGLAITKSLCELMGGSISLVSDQNQGAEFTVTIPSKCKMDVMRDTESNIRPDFETLSKIAGKVIVAEDEEINRDFFSSVLSKSKIDFYLAKNGVEALELAHKHQDADLILMDIKMPIMNGIEATKRILERLPNMKIVAHSAYVQREDVERYQMAGCLDFMAKPFKINELINILKKYLE
jgi:PAS domain S-box-containing protein